MAVLYRDIKTLGFALCLYNPIQNVLSYVYVHIYIYINICTYIYTKIERHWEWGGSRERFKPGSHEHHKHKDKINTKTKLDISETCEDKTTRIFLRLVFLFGSLDLMLITILMSQVWLYSFDLPIVLSLCLRSGEPGLKHIVDSYVITLNTNKTICMMIKYHSSHAHNKKHTR